MLNPAFFRVSCRKMALTALVALATSHSRSSEANDASASASITLSGWEMLILQELEAVAAVAGDVCMPKLAFERVHLLAEELWRYHTVPSLFHSCPWDSCNSFATLESETTGSNFCPMIIKQGCWQSCSPYTRRSHHMVNSSELNVRRMVSQRSVVVSTIRAAGSCGARITLARKILRYDNERRSVIS